MKNEEEQRSVSELPQQATPQPMRKRRGRPVGSFAVKPDADQREQRADMLDTLASLSPIEGLIEGKSVPSQRLQPSAFHAKREAMLLKLINEERPQEADKIIQYF